MRLLIGFAAFYFCASVALVLSARHAFAIGMYSLVPMAFVWMALLASSIIVAVAAVVRKAWLSAILCLAIPFASPAAAFEIGSFLEIPMDYVQVAVMRPIYDGRISQLPQDGKRYAEFNWGGMLFGSVGVVYDETDEVALPSGHQSAAWKRRMKNTDLTCGGEGPIAPVESMGGHYYVTDFGC